MNDERHSGGQYEEEPTFRCRECGETFTSERVYLEHQESQHYGRAKAALIKAGRHGSREETGQEQHDGN